MPPSNIDPIVKAAALADLLAGEQPAVVAERYKLDREQVKKWKQRAVSPAVSPESDAVSPPRRPLVRPAYEAQQRQIGDLILELLAAKLEASAALARTASDHVWLARQSAAELAALGAYLDGTALAIGDRLAGSARPARDPDGDGAA